MKSTLNVSQIIKKYCRCGYKFMYEFTQIDWQPCFRDILWILYASNLMKVRQTFSDDTGYGQTNMITNKTFFCYLLKNASRANKLLVSLYVVQYFLWTLCPIIHTIFYYIWSGIWRNIEVLKRLKLFTGALHLAETCTLWVYSTPSHYTATKARLKEKLKVKEG